LLGHKRRVDKFLVPLARKLLFPFFHQGQRPPHLVGSGLALIWLVLGVIALERYLRPLPNDGLQPFQSRERKSNCKFNRGLYGRPFS
jgi:hypothetical protein